MSYGFEGSAVGVQASLQAAMRLLVAPHPLRKGELMSPQEDARVMPPDPLALDPYSPVVPGRGPERSGSDPLALEPYSPILPDRAPADGGLTAGSSY
jgi:hypothetical protein